MIFSRLIETLPIDDVSFWLSIIFVLHGWNHLIWHIPAGHCWLFNGLSRLLSGLDNWLFLFLLLCHHDRHAYSNRCADRGININRCGFIDRLLEALATYWCTTVWLRRRIRLLCRSSLHLWIWVRTRLRLLLVLIWIRRVLLWILHHMSTCTHSDYSSSSHSTCCASGTRTYLSNRGLHRLRHRTGHHHIAWRSLHVIHVI